MFEKVSKIIDRMSSKYATSSVSSDDLSQEGWLSFLDKKETLECMPVAEALAYITPFIKSAMIHYTYKNRRSIHFIKTKGQQKAANNLLKCISSHSDMTASRSKDIASMLSVSQSDVDTAYAYLFGSDMNITATGRVSTGHCTEKDFELPIVSSLSQVSEKVVKVTAVYSAINELGEREKTILEKRWFSGEKQKTLKSVAKEMNMSFSGVSYVEKEAISTIREKVKAQALSI